MESNGITETKKGGQEPLSETIDNIETKVPGLTIYKDFISQEYHDELVKHVGSGEWDTSLSRRVQHYGYKYDYKKRGVVKGSAPPLPAWSIRLCEHLKERGCIGLVPDQLIINEYKIGQRISRHVDATAFGPVIFSISLGASCNMNFTTRTEKRTFRVTPRTFLKMEGDARYKWFHDIDPVKSGTRYSLTFRTVDTKE